DHLALAEPRHHRGRRTADGGHERLSKAAPQYEQTVAGVSLPTDDLAGRVVPRVSDELDGAERLVVQSRKQRRPHQQVVQSSLTSIHVGDPPRRAGASAARSPASDMSTPRTF